MDNRIYAVFIVLALDLLAIWLLWPKFSTTYLKIDRSPLQQRLMKYFGMPVLAHIAFLFVLSLLENLLNGNQAARFQDHLVRFTLVNMTMFIGFNGLLHAIMIWPRQKELSSPRKTIYYLSTLPSIVMFTLSILLLMRFFQFY